MFDGKIKELLDAVIKSEDFFDYTFISDGKTNKDEGYIGNIFFVIVSGKTKNGKNKTLNLVVKASKDSEILRNQTPIKETYEKEIFIYDRVLEEFRKFEKEMGAENLLNFMPRCYASQISDKSEILIMENLKQQGFSTRDRKTPMNDDYVNLVLEAYGKWHAFSYALKKIKNGVFQELVKNNINVFSYFFEKTGMIDLVLDIYQTALDACVSKDEKDIIEKVKFSKEEAKYIFTDLFFEDSSYNIISHGDCWNNNFMFSYNAESSKPIDVRLLDWQCSGLSSPVMDLSHFIYGCADIITSKDVSPFLKIYHKSLSKSLQSLGCDAQELFPYAKLVEHWKKFSKYGLLLQGIVLKFSMIDTEDCPDFVEAAELGRDFLDNFNVELKNKDYFHKRFKHGVLHYITNLNLPEEM